MKRGRAIVATLAIGLAAGACSDGRTPVVVYSPHGSDLLLLVEKEFERRNPALDVRWLDMGSQEVYDRLRSERTNPQCDVWFGAPDAIFARAATEGLLAHFTPSWAKGLPDESREGGDLYWSVFRTLPVLVWNETLVAEADAPRDWDDLLAPRFRGKLLLRDPMASGVMRTVFGFELAKSVAETGSLDRGFAWLAQLDGQAKEIVANPALLHEKLMRGEGAVTMWELTDTLLERARGAPFGWRFAASGTPVIEDGIAVAAGAPHPDAAHAFIEFAGSDDALLAAASVYRIPARRDLPVEKLPDWARRVLAELKPAVYDRKLAARDGAAWMTRWDKTVRGRGSVAAP